MDVRQANLKIINDIDGTWSVAAAYLGMTENALRNRVYESKGQRLSVDDSLMLQALSKTTHFAEAVAVTSGGTFVKLPGPDSVSTEAVQAQFNELYAEVGLLFSEFARSSADGEIDSNEEDRLKDIGSNLHQKTEQLLTLMFSLYCPRKKVLRVA